MKRDEFGGYKGSITHDTCDGNGVSRNRLHVINQGSALCCGRCGKAWRLVEAETFDALEEWAAKGDREGTAWVIGNSAARRHVAHLLGIQVVDGELTKESIEAISEALREAPVAPESEGGPPSPCCRRKP